MRFKQFACTSERLTLFFFLIRANPLLSVSSVFHRAILMKFDFSLTVLGLDFFILPILKNQAEKNETSGSMELR